jgi:hypothetical protein
MVELRLGVLAISQTLLGAPVEELVRETARQFGFERTGEDIRSAIEAAVRKLADEGYLVISPNGTVSPARS